MRARGRFNGIVRSARTPTGREGDGCGFYIVRFLDRRGGERGFRESGVEHISFGSVRRFDLHVVFHALDNLHRVAAFELGGHVEIDQGLVNPHAIFIRRALYIYGAARFCGRNRGDGHKRDENPKGASHFASKTCGCLLGRAPRGFGFECHREVALAPMMREPAARG